MLNTQSPAKTILHEGKLYSQKFEQLLRKHAGETLSPLYVEGSHTTEDAALPT